MFSNTGKLCLKLFKISCEEIPLFFDWKAEYSNPGQCPKKSIELYLKRQKLWIDPIHFIICFLREVYSQKTGTGGVTDKERHRVYIFMIVSFNATVFENPVLSIKLCNGELVAVRKTVLYDICMTRRNASTRITFLGDTTRIDLIFHG